jgi:hypothetical protein
MKSVGTDLTSDLCPPKSLFIEVRVKQDYGELETPDGDVSIGIYWGRTVYVFRN